MAAPDLTAPRAILESFMVDRCTITDYGAGGIDPESFNSATMEWADATGTVIWSDEPCMFGDQITGYNAEQAEGEASAAHQRFTFKVPVACPLPDRVGLIVELTYCQRDPAQVGRTFQIVGAGGGTHKLVRKFSVVEIVPATIDRPDHQ